MRRFLAIFAAALILCASAANAASAPVKILTIDPIMELIVQFIGGPYVETAAGWSWDAKDRLRTNRAALMNGENAQRPLLALCESQYTSFMTTTRRRSRKGLTDAEKNRPNLHCLYPDDAIKVSPQVFYGDPANLPYTAQKVMTVLSELIPQRYPYFQRRLGEFDARLRTVLISGRRRLSGAEILYVGDSYQAFLQASGCVVTTPTASELSQLLYLARPAPQPSEDVPRSAIRAAANRKADRLRQILHGRILLIDYHADPRLHAGLRGASVVYISPPRGEDLLFFIHSTILLIGSHLDQLR